MTASRAIFLIRWRARLLIVGMVLCISPLGANARVAGRSSLQRVRFSVFALVGVRVFHVYPFFFCARSGCGAGRERQFAHVSLSSANENEQEAHTKAHGVLVAPTTPWSADGNCMFDTAAHFITQCAPVDVASHAAHGTTGAEQSPELAHDSSRDTKTRNSLSFL